MKKISNALFVILLNFTIMAQAQWTMVGPSNYTIKEGGPFNNLLFRNNSLYVSNSNSQISNQAFTVGKWDGQTWTLLESANSLMSNNEIKAMCFDPVGNIYTTGLATDSLGHLFVNKWDGTNWNAIGGSTIFSDLSSSSSYFTTLCSDNNSNIYLGGNYSDTLGNYKSPFKYDVSGWVELNAFQNNLSVTKTNKLVSSPSGSIYAIGSGVLDTSGAVCVAAWNGSIWSIVGGYNALNVDNIRDSYFDQGSNKLYILGVSNGNYIIQFYDGISWSSNLLPVNMPTNIYSIEKLLIDNNSNVYLGVLTNSNEAKVLILNTSTGSLLSTQQDDIIGQGVFGDLCLGNNGKIYLSGNKSKNYTLAINCWDGTRWTDLGKIYDQGLNGRINYFAKSHTGEIYSTGTSTNSQGNYFVAKWNGANWQELGGLNSLPTLTTLQGLCVNPNGDVIAFGKFSLNAQTSNLAKWNGQQWQLLGNLFFNSVQNQSEIISDNAGDIYVVKGVRDPQSNFSCVAKFSANTWTYLSSNASLSSNDIDDIRAACLDTNNNIYVTGDFVDSLGNHFVSKYINGAWIKVGDFSGICSDGVLNSLYADENGNVYAGGTANDWLVSPVVLKWNGGNWSLVGNYSLSYDMNTIYQIDGNANGQLILADQGSLGERTFFSNNAWNLLGLQNEYVNQNFQSPICVTNDYIFSAGNFNSINGGSNYSSYYQTTTLTNIQSLSFQNQSHPFSAYPIPMNERLIITNTASNPCIHLFDMLGNEINLDGKIQHANNQVIIQSAYLSSGIYIIKVNDESKLITKQ